MTICIGALCSGGQEQARHAVIVASDRMVTLGQIIEFEHETPKIVDISTSVVALMAGDALRASSIVGSLMPATVPDARTVQNVADQAAAGYSVARDSRIESEIYQPRGLTRATFYAGNFPMLLQNIAFQLDQLVAGFNLNVSLLIAGVDASGAHLFEIANPGGRALDYGQIGHHAIGIGQLHALQSLIGFGHSRSRTIAETLFAVYVAKRRAEVAPGVGKETDLAVINHQGIRKISLEQLNALDKLYEEIQRPASPEIILKVQDLLNDGGSR